jgi:hypothetical protein
MQRPALEPAAAAETLMLWKIFRRLEHMIILRPLLLRHFCP